MSTAAKSIFEMLDAEPESDKGTISLGRAKGEIRFEHVFLKYPGQTGYALQDINLTIKPGEHVALVGQSGSGKTSIVNLLPRFWELTSGRITLDGHDIRDLSLESLVPPNFNCVSGCDAFGHDDPRKPHLWTQECFG